MTKTDKLIGKIADLERKISKGATEQTALEAELAKVYEADGDTEAAHRKLSAHRENINDLIGVIRQLDQRLKEVAEAERDEILRDINARFEKNFAAAEGEIRKAATALDKVLSTHISEGSGPVAQQIIDLSIEAIEAAYRNWAAEQRVKRLPDQFPIPKRDDLGRCTYAMPYSSTIFFDFRFNRERDIEGTLAYAGPHRGASFLDG